MMNNLVTDPAQVTPAWLTGVLLRQGCLGRCSVTSIESELSSTIVSSILRLVVSYSADSPASCPSRLFLKLSKPDAAPELARKEVQFYNDLTSAPPDLPLIPCYDAVYSEEAGRSHVLLSDLSETHTRPPWPLPPSVEQCGQP